MPPVHTPNASPVTAEQIEAALRQALTPQSLRVINESDQHAGHAGADGGSHWRVQIVSDAMSGQSRVARHRLVYAALAGVIAQGIHALAIEAATPQEVSVEP